MWETTNSNINNNDDDYDSYSHRGHPETEGDFFYENPADNK